ncbi:hypothetical protein [Desulfosporosinus acididurans]|nr:hypothetical protein [Desulfosporosinus acididurans]
MSSFSKVGTTTATFNYQVLDESGKDITSTVPAAQLSAVTSVSSSITLDPNKGLGTITYNSASDSDKSIIITLVDLTTGNVATLDSSSGAGSYTAPANNSASEVSSSNQYSDQKVSKIAINSTKLGIPLPYGNQRVGYATYTVYDQYGADITSTSLANNIQFTSNVGTITAKRGLITLSFFSNINSESLTNITITGVDSNSNVTTTATLTVGH